MYYGAITGMVHENEEKGRENSLAAGHSRGNHSAELQ